MAQDPFHFAMATSFSEPSWLHHSRKENWGRRVKNQKMSRISLQARADRRYRVCNVAPRDPVRKHARWGPQNPFTLDHPPQDSMHSLRKCSCSIGHQRLVNTSLLISLSNELGERKENTVPLIEYLLCTGHCTRSSPTVSTGGVTVATFYSDGEVTLTTWEVKCPVQGHTENR